MLRLNEIEINNINSISNLKLKFNEGLNILCGTNGVGKTTILECIACSIYGRINVRNSVSCDFGEINTLINNNGEILHNKVHIQPDYAEKSIRSISEEELIYYNTSHRSSSRRIDHDYDIDRPPMSPLDAVKRWLYRNYFEPRDVTEVKSINLNLIQDCINRIDNNMSFLEVKVSSRLSKLSSHNKREYRTVDVLVSTPYGIMDIGYLSSGYKACFTILIDLIRQLERQTNNEVQDFEGIVLIDEIDLHLHPEWQTKITAIIKWLIPKAQIIVTTHSPHVIQSAQAGEIIPLGVDSEKNVYVRDLPESSEYGFQGWNIEEILVHVMGLSSPMSKLFREKLVIFERGLATEDKDQVVEAFKSLSAMLYYRNPLQALLKIQASEFLEEDEE
ncbi:hypothetical protein BVG16_28820 [Paenibacillus selenitireducens]|uniref:AAA+ ATPase domain-containing protein n=1 Tax=Paenibacillus selenitireducens TaxID=1324314 RepID=A0A1T2X179_9BACL|nr:AAA family ATPase [Paenibacillus selenitireducens]OPA73466.1 hypothetical protein BVG16_28820 [Paenibacillus selenitireducens]